MLFIRPVYFFRKRIHLLLELTKLVAQYNKN